MTNKKEGKTFICREKSTYYELNLLFPAIKMKNQSLWFDPPGARTHDLLRSR